MTRLSDSDDPDPAANCPYCRSPDACKHLLLSIDQDELGEASGDLAAVFAEKLEDAQQDLAQQIARALLDAAERLAASTTGSPIHDRPGLTWNYRNLYVRNTTDMRTAITKFKALKVRITVAVE